MHAITFLHADLVRARDRARLEAASHARRVRECRGPARRARRVVTWPVLPLAVLLGLALGISTVTASRTDLADGRPEVERATAGTVLVADALASDVSVAVLLRATTTGTVPDVDAPGKADTGTTPVPAS